jgi:hypothetical protein
MRKFFAGISNCRIALAVVLLAVVTGRSSPSLSPSDPTTPSGGSDELSVCRPNLSSGRPPYEAASRIAASPVYTLRSPVEFGSSNFSAAAAPIARARDSNEVQAYPPNPSPASELTGEDALKIAATAGHLASSDAALSDASRSDHSTPAALSNRARVSDELVVLQPNLSPSEDVDSEPAPRTAAEIAEARAYLIETASPGYTMTLQGPEIAIGRLHPEFALRLASAIREARGAGLPFAGVFSAYRPPAFGIGGFSDKFNSLHTYGLAVDMHAIGSPGSPEAQLWHQIAAKNGVVCPYGPRDRAEWNHCQPTSVKIILADNPLRETVSSAGPLDLESMFEAGNFMIEDMAHAADSLSWAAPTPVRTPEAVAKHLEPLRHIVTSRTKRNLREAARSVGHAKFAARGNVKETPMMALQKRGVAAKSVRHGKLASPDRAKGTPIIAVEEGRRKSKSGRA